MHLETNWAEVELRGTKLRGPRRVKALARAVRALCLQPQPPLSAALGNGTRQAAGDLCTHEDRRAADLIAGPMVSTGTRRRSCERVLVAEDTTYFTYGQDQSGGLGRLNGSARGLVGHAALAVNPDGVLLEVLWPQLWGDTDSPVPGYKLQVSPEIFQCDRANWTVSLACIQEALPVGQAALVIARVTAPLPAVIRLLRIPPILS